MRLNISYAQKVTPLDVDFGEGTVNDDNAQSSEVQDTSKGKSTQINRCSTLGEFRSLIASTHNIDPAVMKIVHRGRCLVGDDNTPLSSCSLKENDKLLVLGKAPTISEDAGWKKLVDYEKKHLCAIGKIYDKNTEDLDGLEKNYLEGKMRDESMKKMELRLRQFTEDCLKHLETIDALEIVTERTFEKQAQLNREKRKYMINGLQELLNKNDKQINRLKDYIYKVKHPEERL